MIKTIIRTKNDMVMVLDENGEELPEYEGSFTSVKDKIIADAREESVFNHWFGHGQKPHILRGECF